MENFIREIDNRCWEELTQPIYNTQLQRIYDAIAKIPLAKLGELADFAESLVEREQDA